MNPNIFTAWEMADRRFEEAFPHLHNEHIRPSLRPAPGLNEAHAIRWLWKAIECLEEAEIYNKIALVQISNDLGNLLQTIEENVTNNVQNEWNADLTNIQNEINNIQNEFPPIWDAINQLSPKAPDPGTGGNAAMALATYVELNTPFGQVQQFQSPQAADPNIEGTDHLKDNLVHNASFFDRESGLNFNWNRNFRDNSAGILPPCIFIHDAAGRYIKELIPGDTSGYPLGANYVVDDIFVSTIVDNNGLLTKMIEISFLNEDMKLYAVSPSDLITYDAGQSLTQYHVLTEMNSQATFNHVIGARTKFNSIQDYMAAEVVIASYKSGAILTGTRNDLYNNAPLTVKSNPWATFGMGLNGVQGRNRASATNDGSWLLISNGLHVQSLYFNTEAGATDYYVYEDTPGTTILNNMTSRLYRKISNLDLNTNNRMFTSNQALSVQIVPFSSNYESDYNHDVLMGLKITPENGWEVKQNTFYYLFSNGGLSSQIQSNARNHHSESTAYFYNSGILAGYSREGRYTISANIMSSFQDLPLDINNNNATIPPVNGAYDSQYSGLGNFANEDWELDVGGVERNGYVRQNLYHAKTPLSPVGGIFTAQSMVIWERVNRIGMKYNQGTPAEQDQQIGQWEKTDWDEWINWRNRLNTSVNNVINITDGLSSGYTLEAGKNIYTRAMPFADTVGSSITCTQPIPSNCSKILVTYAAQPYAVGQTPTNTSQFTVEYKNTAAPGATPVFNSGTTLYWVNQVPVSWAWWTAGADGTAIYSFNLNGLSAGNAQLSIPHINNAVMHIVDTSGNIMTFNQSNFHQFINMYFGVMIVSVDVYQTVTLT